MAAPPAADRATLVGILNDGILSRAYEEFSRREHNDENLQVLRRIHAFASEGSSADKARAGVSIINKFVRSGSANTDAKTRATLEAVARRVQSLQIGGATDYSEEITTMEGCFEKWQAVATREVVADSLPRFLASELYTAALEESRAAARPGLERRASMAARARGMLASLGQSMRLSVAAAGPSVPAGRDGPAIEVELNMTTPADRKRSLLDLLAHPRTRTAFVDFCAKELCDENVALLLDIHAFRCAPDDAARTVLAKRMLNTYIRSGSPREANIDSRTRMYAEMLLSMLATGGGGSAATPASGGAASTPGGARAGGVVSPVRDASARLVVNADGEDALVRVETELINMLSGELLPRFAISKTWLDLAAAAAAAAATSGFAAPAGAAAPGDRSRTASVVSSAPAPRGSGAASAAPVAAAASSAGPDIAAEWAAALADEDGATSGASAGSRSLLSLRDKYYVFGVSMTAAVRSLGGGPKKADLEAVGAEIRRTSVKSGYLVKRAHHKPSWKRRWFVLTPSVLAYFPDASVSTPSGAFLVKEMRDVGLEWSSTGETTPSDIAALPYAFVVHTPHRRYALQASSTKERDRWVLALTAARTGNPAAIANADWNADAFKIAAQAVLDRMPQLPVADLDVSMLHSHSDSLPEPSPPVAMVAASPARDVKTADAAQAMDAHTPSEPDAPSEIVASTKAAVTADAPGGGDDEGWDASSPVAYEPTPAAPPPAARAPSAESEEEWNE